ncbi:TraB/GumN family protein [Parvicella tangerina]|uniref:TraB/GumN family protein n=1 Tax=Parvicella tangerina TaxID=2829795 RepID=A0A916JLN8_9FLAO|nr:TraB/GumN family protein [Parvicella tangerina]CAG5080588.1 hypothetical protein CRYO30217_01387 [Parvicella tangerina]
MKRLLTYLFGSALVFSAVGQTTQKSLAWKITGNGLEKPSYLYGTMHTQDQRAFEFKDGVLDAHKSTEVYVMEVNMDLADQFAIMDMMMMKGDTTLEDLLSKSQYDSVALYFNDSLGQPLSMFKSMMPILTAQTIELQNLSAEQDLALDLYFADLAKEQGKEVIGLETAEEQVAALSAVSYKDQALALYEMVKNKYAGKKDNTINDLVDLYVQGDLEGMLALTSEESMTSEKAQTTFEDNLILKRNRVMTQRMTKVIHEKSAFVAVGAAHLGGENGIITMLRILGYTVEPL